LISVNDAILDHLPQVSQHPEKSHITIKNLLMMKSGINYNNGGYTGETNKLDLFNNPVGYRTSLGKMLRILLFFSGCCSKTEVFEQLYYFMEYLQVWLILSLIWV
jgi:hypothetical protein